MYTLQEPDNYNFFGLVLGFTI